MSGAVHAASREGFGRLAGHVVEVFRAGNGSQERRLRADKFGFQGALPRSTGISTPLLPCPSGDQRPVERGLRAGRA